MYVIRPISLKDLEAFERLAFTADIGMTSLPRNRKLLQHKIEASLEAFDKNISVPQHENYFFVIENMQTGEIGGCCGIYSKTGIEEPDYYYHIETLQPTSKLSKSNQEIKILRPVIYHNGASEICALYLSPEFRKEGLGRLLSLSRFLFIAINPQRFDQAIIAEIRGVIDKNGVAPFWEGLGRRFLDIKFDELMTLRESGKDFIASIIPNHPIYVNLLPKETQESIQKAHTNTKPALNMLVQEGFSLTDDIDLFDGGPKISALTKEIRTIKTSVLATVQEITERAIESEQLMLSNNKLDFRACYGHIRITPGHYVSISSDVAKALNLQIGDKIRYASATPLKNNKEDTLCRASTAST